MLHLICESSGHARELFNEIIGYRRSDTLASSEKTREALRQLARNFQHSLKIQEISTHAGIYISELLNKQMQGAILKDRLREID